MRMFCRHVVLNFRPRRPLSTFNITSSSTLVTTATLPAAYVSTKAGAGEAAGVAGQAIASIQWFLSWFHIKKTRRLEQLVRLSDIRLASRPVVYGSWRLCMLVKRFIVWQVLILNPFHPQPFTWVQYNSCLWIFSWIYIKNKAVRNYMHVV